MDDLVFHYGFKTMTILKAGDIKGKQINQNPTRLLDNHQQD
jgi:hypothetical protein